MVTAMAMLPFTRTIIYRGFTCYSTQLRLQSVARFKLPWSKLTLARNQSFPKEMYQHQPCRFITSSDPASKKPPQQVKNEPPQLTFDEELAKLSFFERYKKLFKEFWYVLLPVHAATSLFWFGSFYLLVKSGVKIDINTLLNYVPLPMPQAFEDTLKNPHLGALALTFALYKFATPIRYMSTVYVAVPTIKTLVRKGIIRPIPKLTSSSKIQREITRIRNRVVKKRGSEKKKKKYIVLQF